MKNLVLACTWFLIGLLFHTVLIGKDLEFSIPLLIIQLIGGILQLIDFKLKTNGKEISGI